MGNPEHWKNYYRLLEDDLKRKEEFERKYLKREWSSFERELERDKIEASYYTASEPGSGRKVIVEYSRAHAQGGVLSNVVVVFY